MRMTIKSTVDFEISAGTPLYIKGSRVYLEDGTMVGEIVDYEADPWEACHADEGPEHE